MCRLAWSKGWEIRGYFIRPLLASSPNREISKKESQKRVATRSATVATTLFWLSLADRTFWPPLHLAEADLRAPGGLKSSVRNGEAGRLALFHRLTTG